MNRLFVQKSLRSLIWIQLVVLSLLNSCQTTSTEEGSEQLNILWLVTEDMGPYIEAFGDSTIATPNLSRLAREGIIFPNFFSTSGVCAPSRAAIATGMYPSSIGANHMRTNSYTDVTGLPAYEAIPPPEVKMISELLRGQGYYCTNNSKQDYQFKAPMTAWDENGPYAHWRNRAEGQPFYSIFNFTDTHESGLFEPYGFRYGETRHYHAGDTSYTWKGGRMSEEETPMNVSKDLDFPIPPYLPNTALVRRDMWKLYNNIAEMDKQVGAILKQLEEDGLLEKTIIFFYGDHGGPLPRQKRLIYDSGLNTPLMVRFPNQEKAATKDEQLASFIDLAPTVLSLIDVEPPAYMQGKAFLGKHRASVERTYIHAAADRFDGFTDAIRAVRNKQYKYIRNYRPEQGYYLPVVYRERIPTMQELLRLRDAGQLSEVQAQWFRKSKPAEELFDCKADPHELNNLANDPAYQEVLTKLRVEMDRWLEAIGDQPNLPEKELIAQLWNGRDSQPTTADPRVTISEGKISVTCATEGASIGYQLLGGTSKASKAWQLYQEPIPIVDGTAKIQVKAHRIGYLSSEVIVRDVE
ncbi:MAG: sulfatase [Bacteroidota bacterium]